MTEWVTFDLPINGKIEFAVKNNRLGITINLDATVNTAPYALELPSHPLHEYGDPETLNQYLAAAKRNFIQIVGGQLQREAAELIGVSEWRVYEMIKRKVLPAYRPSPQRLRLRLGGVRAFIRQQNPCATREMSDKLESVLSGGACTQQAHNGSGAVM